MQRSTDVLVTPCHAAGDTAGEVAAEWGLLWRAVLNHLGQKHSLHVPQHSACTNHDRSELSGPVIYARLLLGRLCKSA